MAYCKLPDGGFFEKHAAKIAFAGPDECWLWTAHTDRYGYGKVGARRAMRKAHREAYEAVHGPGSADGLVVRHRCDTPPCCNPDHLVIGTQADNVRDKMDRGRQARGETNGSAKLTEADVRTIRAEYVPRSRTHGTRALARKYGVAPSLISMIANRERWGHVL